MKKPKPLVCSFCGTSTENVPLLISTPSDSKLKAYICNFCVEICILIMRDKMIKDANTWADEAGKQIKPAEKEKAKP